VIGGKWGFSLSAAWAFVVGVYSRIRHFFSKNQWFQSKPAALGICVAAVMSVMLTHNRTVTANAAGCE